ncbi:MAG: hypothetical protein H8E12_16940 [Rhodobacteraceae bacterium]|nr:hypothetical protein [Paracoccaceae bacterium]
MLQLVKPYIDEIRVLGEDPQLFPLGPQGGFGSDFTFTIDEYSFAEVETESSQGNTSIPVDPTKTSLEINK